ncbi:MAG: phosphate/phosphite/phosphonate ABC transporter substrate-binding protein [Leptospirales bacterium]
MGRKSAVLKRPSIWVWISAAVAWVLWGCLANAGSASAQTRVRIGMIPDAGATQVSIEEKKPLQKYLAKMLGRPVQLIIPTSYNATVEALGNKSLDFAYLGGLTYVKANALYGVVPLVQRDVDQRFQSLFIVRDNSPIKTLKDLKGKTFAFGDISSTSGHLFPALAMENAGVDPKKDLRWSRYTGSHVATAQAVASGAVQAGALDETVFKSLIDRGRISHVHFFTTPPFADYVWVARKGVSPALAKKFVRAFLHLKAGRDDSILHILRGNRFVRASDSEYSKVRLLAKQFGLM